MPGRSTRYRTSGTVTAPPGCPPTVVLLDYAGASDGQSWSPTLPDAFGDSDSQSLRHTHPDAIGAADTQTLWIPSLSDAVGASDRPIWSPILPDAFGGSDRDAWRLTNTDAIGGSDALNIIGSPRLSDSTGMSDGTVKIVATENAILRSGTPDNDPWGDAHVNRSAAQAGNNFGAAVEMPIQAVTAITQIDGYMKIDFTRFVSFTAFDGTSAFTFDAFWPNVALNPNLTLTVHLRSNASSPFTESTITANNKARFTSASPYTSRVFTFALSGTLNTCVVTLTAAEVGDFLGKWLEVQMTIPDLSTSTLSVYPREETDANAIRARYSLNLTP